MDRKTRTWIFLVIFAGGAGIRALDLGHGIDGGIRESWREADYGSVARNFLREGMDIRYPRIDWRGEGSGIAEMEFPIVPWAMAALYHVFGVHEIIGRIISYVFGLLTLLVFFALARRLLPGNGALFAFGLFALAPLSVRVSNALQPESMMLFFLLAAVLAFLRWREADTGMRWLAVTAATAAAVLTKPSAAHIGILFLFLLVKEGGVKVLFRPLVLAFGGMSLLPAAAWYIHSHGLWLEFGNSLGVSNESHWLGLDMFLRPRLIGAALFRTLRMETALVATLPGFFAALIILWRRRKAPSMDIIVGWLLALAAYYLLAIRTTGDNWASYYHVVSAAPLALLFGLGFQELVTRSKTALAAAFSLPLLFIIVAQAASVRFPGTSVIGLEIMAFALIAAWPAGALTIRRLTPTLLLVLLLAIPSFLGLQTARELHPSRYAELYAGAQTFAPLIPPGALILASGGNGIEPTGRTTAYNASYMFYWLDRKGFNIRSDGQTLEAVAGYARRGARFFVLEREALKARPEFEAELGRTYKRVAQTGAAILYDLSAAPVQSDLR